MGVLNQLIMPDILDKVTVYYVTEGFSGHWAFCPEALKAFAPQHMLEPSQFSSGKIMEASLRDIQPGGTLWALSDVTTLAKRDPW